MNLLDYVMEKASKEETPTKTSLSEIMKNGTMEEVSEAWEKIYAAGGYEALED